MCISVYQCCFSLFVNFATGVYLACKNDFFYWCYLTFSCASYHFTIVLFFLLVCTCPQSSLENSMPWSFFLTNEGNSWLFLFMFQKLLYKSSCLSTTETILGKFCLLNFSKQTYKQISPISNIFNILSLKASKKIQNNEFKCLISFLLVGCLDIHD